MVFLKSLRIVVIFFLCSFSAQAQEHSHLEHKHWGYIGDVAPQYWYSLDTAYQIAKNGKSQSPIDIITNNLATSKIVKKPVFHYTNVQCNIENNGHTIQLNPVNLNDNMSSARITLDGVDYFVKQAHFHSPSEHIINGKQYIAELHIVHKNAIGNAAVVGFFIEEGAENKVILEAFANIPKENTQGRNTVLSAPINFNNLLTGNETVYRYDGSLTTPPCSEGIKWNVFEKPLQMSKKQIDAFKAIYNGNNRPIQPLNSRPISKTK